jgi:hypothetical protein
MPGAMFLILQKVSLDGKERRSFCCIQCKKTEPMEMRLPTIPAGLYV